MLLNYCQFTYVKIAIILPKPIYNIYNSGKKRHIETVNIYRVGQWILGDNWQCTEQKA